MWYDGSETVGYMTGHPRVFFCKKSTKENRGEHLKNGY